MKYFKHMERLYIFWVLFCSSYVCALGLNDVNVMSKLYQPLKAEIKLTNFKGLNSSEIFANLASESDFERAGILRPNNLVSIRFKTMIKPDGTGVIYVYSTKKIEEPFLNFLLEVQWPSGRLLREYTLLIDPPLFDNEISAPIQPPQSATSYPVSTSYPVTELQDSLAAVARKNKALAVDSSAPQYPDVRLGESSGQTYRVKQKDSLMQIAGHLTFDDKVSIQQTMMALLRLNPQAFIGHNINRLKNGVVLQIPSTATALALSHDQAAWQVAMHNQAWRERRDLPYIDGQLHRYNDTNDGKQVSSDKSRLRIVSPRSKPGGAGSDTSENEVANGGDHNDLLITREKVVALTRENNEIIDRLKDLDEQIKTLKKLVMLKDDQIAALQKYEIVDAGDHVEMIGETNVFGDIEKEPDEVKKGDKEESAEIKKVDEKGSKSKKLPVQNKVVLPAETSFFTSTLFFISMILLSLSIVAGTVYYAKKRNNNDDEDEQTEILDLGLDLEGNDSDSSNGVLSEVKKTGDPIVDADTFMSYGSFDDAIKLLKKAIEEDSSRTDLVVKLLEVYSEKSDLDNFKAGLSSLEKMGDLDALKSAEIFKARFPEGTFAALSAESSEELPLLSDEDEINVGLDTTENSIDPSALDEFTLGLDDAVPESSSMFMSESDDSSYQDDKPEGLDFDLGDSVAFDEALKGDGDSYNDTSVETNGLDLVNDLTDNKEILNDGLELLDPGLELGNTEDVLNDNAAIEEDELNVESSSDWSEDEDVLEFNDDLDDEFSDDNEVSTKLDLARAYIDMGDNDGASDILNEVVEEGTPEQQAEAKEIIDQL